MEAEPSATIGSEIPGRASPRVAVVVVASAPAQELRLWLDPIASYGAVAGMEVIVVGADLSSYAAEWGPQFAQVRFVHSDGDLVARRRAGAEATQADVLLFTDDMDPGAYRRLVNLAEALGLRNEDQS